VEAREHLNGNSAVAPMSPYLTAAEAAAYLRTTVQGVYSLVKRGRLHPMPGRPGRLLFRRQDLDDYLTVRYRS
jgi:excisionase family DNA binding protein